MARAASSDSIVAARTKLRRGDQTGAMTAAVAGASVPYVAVQYNLFAFRPPAPPPTTPCHQFGAKPAKQKERGKQAQQTNKGHYRTIGPRMVRSSAS